jgi:ABC-type multidrug transport system fused ATPase/permease subunit
VNSFWDTNAQQLLSRAWGLLSARDKSKVAIVTLGQVLLSFLDLLGVALIGMIGALTIRGVSSQAPGDRVSRVLDFMSLSDSTLQRQVTILGLLACVVLVARTLISITVTKKMFRFLAIRSANLTTELLSKLINQSISKINLRTNQETLYGLTSGVSIIYLGIIGTSVLILSDLALLAVVLTGVFIADSGTAIISVLFFGLVGLLMYLLSHKRVTSLSKLNYEHTIYSNELILQSINTYRELLVQNRRSYIVGKVQKSRETYTRTAAELSFLPYISKYVIETSVIFVALLLGAYQFTVSDSSRAVATLSIFLAAGTRLAPAILRVQQSFLLVKGNLEVCRITLDLAEDLHKASELSTGETSEFSKNHDGFFPDINLENVTFAFNRANNSFIEKLNLRIPINRLTVIVGKSGSGKTTLVDLILGVLETKSGKVSISGVPPLEAFQKWPGAIAYVPQEVSLVDGTIRENICLGFDKDEVLDEDVEWAANIATLGNFVEQTPNGLETKIGTDGLKLSGGQRQKIGIARAVLSRPKLLILDEATSSLDGQAEYEVTEAINSIKFSTSVLMIAHRLSTVREADKVIYLDTGKLVAEGTFEDVRNSVPDFDHQAKLLGL